jgi:hypothetical protein
MSNFDSKRQRFPPWPPTTKLKSQQRVSGPRTTFASVHWRHFAEEPNKLSVTVTTAVTLQDQVSKRRYQPTAESMNRTTEDSGRVPDPHTSLMERNFLKVHKSAFDTK